MWFSIKLNLFSSNSKRVVHPLKTTSKIEVSEYFKNYVDELINEDNKTLNEIINKRKNDNALSTTTMSVDDNCSIITNNEPPNIILDELTQYELIFYEEMIKNNISSFTMRYRSSSYYKENIVVTLFPPLSELKYFNGKNVKMRLIFIDELGEKLKCQEYINMHNGDFYDHHTFGELNYNKRNICDKLKAAFDSEKLPQICTQN